MIHQFTSPGLQHFETRGVLWYLGMNPVAALRMRERYGFGEVLGFWGFGLEEEEGDGGEDG